MALGNADRPEHDFVEVGSVVVADEWVEHVAVAVAAAVVVPPVPSSFPPK